MPNPASLFHLMKKYFKKKVIDFISSEKCESEENFLDFRFYYQTELPQIFLDEFMANLHVYYSDKCINAKMLKRILRLFMSQDTKEFKIYPLNALVENMHQHDVCEYLDYFEATNKILELYKPKLAHFMFRADNITYSQFEKILKSITNLKKVTIKAGSLDQKYIDISLKNCPLLEELGLEVRNFVLLEDQLESLPKHELVRILRIKVFDLFDYTISVKAIDLFLEKFPNLQIIDTKDTFPFNLLFSSKIPNDLKELIVNDKRFYSLQTFHKVYEICPKLQTLQFRTPETGLLEFISNFKYLNKLSLFECNMDELFQLFTICGSQLTSLTIHQQDINVTLLLELCPNLEYLFLKNIVNLNIENRVVIHDKLKYLDLELEYDATNVFYILKGVTSIEIFKLLMWPSELNHVDLSQLIPIWKNIKFLRIACATFFTVEYIKDFVRSWHQLEEMRLPFDPIPERYEEIKKFIDDNNFNIKFEDQCWKTSYY